MARYVTTVRTGRSAADAFAFMADLRNFAEWDPGVSKVVQVEGNGGGRDAVFDVTLTADSTAVPRPKGFKVDHYEIAVHGLCADCARKK